MDLDLPIGIVPLVDVTGVVANAVLGGAVARSLRLDPVGFVALALVSGLGGGLIRDLLLQQGLPAALTGPTYLAAVIAGAGVAFLLDLRARWANRALVGFDALALGCWSATGTIKALGAGVHWLPAILVGVVTAVGGGVLRDLLVGNVPAIFGSGPLYATVAVIGSVETVIVTTQFARPDLGSLMSILTCAALAIAARVRGWYLPTAVEWNDRVTRNFLRAMNRAARWRHRDDPDQPGAGTER